MKKAGFSRYSVVFLDGQKCIRKYPKKGLNREKWFFHQQTHLISLHFLEQYKGDVCFPNILSFGEDSVLETFMEGEPLSADLYESLPVSEQDKIAKDFAGFLFFLHQKKYDYKEKKHPIILKQWPSRKEVLAFFNGYITPEEKAEFQKLEKVCSDTSDERIVWCHFDLKPVHILYDKKTKKLSVLDFGAAHRENIYHDFFPIRTHCFGFSYLFLKKIVRAYNTYTDSPINEKKVGWLHLLGIWRQIARHGVTHTLTEDEKKKKIEFMRFLLARVRTDYFNGSVFD